MPVLALMGAAGTWGRDLPGWLVALSAVLLVAAVLVAVVHAEDIAHQVGEPFGSLVLALAVTLIEVALIVTLTVTKGGAESALARDTVFAAVMITCNGIVGLALLIGALRRRTVRFNAEGSGAALASVTALATLTLVLPTFTVSSPGPTYTPTQLAFAGVVSLTIYVLFVVAQTRRHRDLFLTPAGIAGADPSTDEGEAHPGGPPVRPLWATTALLVAALVGVVGLSKAVSPTLERAVNDVGLPIGVVGVVIALIVLAPEGLAAARSAMRDEVQTSLNLAYGSAMASIGLTIPVIAVASIWLAPTVLLGLGPLQIVLLALTVALGILTVTPGRATLVQAGLHLVTLLAFVFLAAYP